MRPARLALAGLVVLFAAATCGEEGTAPAPSPGAGGTAATTASSGGHAHTTSSSSTGAAGAHTGSGGSAADGGPGGSGACGPIEKPAVIPDGWLPWTEWACKCPFWIPPDKDHMPKPVEWEPCGLPGLPGCRKMVTWWAKDNFAIGIAGLFKDGAGKPVLVVGRTAGDDWTQTIIADPDGPLYFAMMRPTNSATGCELGIPTTGGGRIGFAAWGDGTTAYVEDSPIDGLIWGQFPQFYPKVAPIRDATQDNWDWVTGAGWWLRGGTASGDVLFSPDFSTSKQLWPQPGSDMPSNWANLPQIIGNDVLFVTADPYRAAIMAYDNVHSVHPLVSYGDDMTRGASNLGTDGKDMVWSYGEGKQPFDHGYPKVSVMTAPYTTDPAKLQPRRVRADPGMWAGESFAVGCGYAGHRGTPARRAFLTRLSDGAAWVLDGGPNDSVTWPGVLGFTCDEVFVNLNLNTIARIKLDSLGPGLPPD
jgi:hypothetical protein